MANLIKQPPETVEALIAVIRYKVAESGMSPKQIEENNGPSRQRLSQVLNGSPPQYGFVRSLETALGLKWFTVEVDAQALLEARSNSKSRKPKPKVKWKPNRGVLDV